MGNHQAIAMAIRDIDGTENCGIAFLRFLPTNIFFGPSRGLIVLGGLFSRFTFPVEVSSDGANFGATVAIED